MSRTISRSQGICCSVTKLPDGLLRSPSFSISDKVRLLGDPRMLLSTWPSRSVGPNTWCDAARPQCCSPDQARQLLDAIDPSELIGLRRPGTEWADGLQHRPCGCGQYFDRRNFFENVGGCGCMKRVASATRSPAIIACASTSMPGSEPPESAGTRKAGCSTASQGKQS